MSARDLLTESSAGPGSTADSSSQATMESCPDAGHAVQNALSAPRAHARCGTCGNGSPNRHGFVVCARLPEWKWFAPASECRIGAWCEQPPEAARRAAQAGIDQAVADADRVAAGWSDRALEYVRLFAAEHSGRRFIGHDIVQASIAAGVSQPPNAKAWGGPIQRAARAGHIVKVGTAPDPNRHTNPVPLWEAC